MRLDKWLSNTGIGSRNDVKKYLRAGRVEVNGTVEKDPARQVDPAVDTVLFDGDSVAYQRYAYFMMYKPQGVLSATEDARDEVVVDLLEPEDQHFDVFPVGRLDKDAEGLLLLTNDGTLAHRLLSPKYHVPKRYYVEVVGCLTEADAAEIRSGVTLEDGYETRPGELMILTSGESSEAEIVIHEGKFHQVKRMFLALGKRVTFLKRVQMGPLLLDTALEPGTYRELVEEELEALHKLR